MSPARTPARKAGDSAATSVTASFPCGLSPTSRPRKPGRVEAVAPGFATLAAIGVSTVRYSYRSGSAAKRLQPQAAVTTVRARQKRCDRNTAVDSGEFAGAVSRRVVTRLGGSSLGTSFMFTSYRARLPACGGPVFSHYLAVLMIGRRSRRTAGWGCPARWVMAAPVLLSGNLRAFA